MAEPEKIVFRLSRSVWKERSTLNKVKTGNDQDVKVEEEDEGDTSPTLRRRSVPNKSAVFNPSGCNQCGTTTTCRQCLRRKEQELLTMKSQYKAIKASQVHFEKNGDAQSYSTEAPSTISPPVAEKNSKPSLVEKEVKSDDKVVNKGGRRRTISESVPTSEEALKALSAMKSSFSIRMIQNYIDVAEHEVFLSAINSMTNEDILQHLMSLRVEYIQKLLRPPLQSLMIHTRNNDIFNYPVDPVALGLKDYFLKITHPMDLGTIKRRLLRGYYQTVQSCVDDVMLVFRNATEYNHVQNIVHQVAVFLNNVFLEDMKSIHEKIAKESERRNTHSCDRCHGSACSFCGEKCHKWEPPIIVCHGPCGQRIKRLGIYYVSTDGAMVFCQKCYTTSGPVVSAGGGGETPTSACLSPRPTTPGVSSTSPRPGPFTPSYGSQPQLLTPGGTGGSGSQTPKPLLKRDMLKRRFDEEIFEPWVDCNTCHRRVHQVCALYNPFYEKTPSKTTISDIPTASTSSSSSSSALISISDTVILPKGAPSSSATSSTTSVEAPKMVTRKRGRHKKGTHLHLSESRARAAASVSVAEEEETETDDNHPPFQCAICKLKAAINKSKRGKRGAVRASTDETHKKKGHHKKVRHEPAAMDVTVAVKENSTAVDVVTLPPSLDSEDSTLTSVVMTEAVNSEAIIPVEEVEDHAKRTAHEDLESRCRDRDQDEDEDGDQSDVKRMKKEDGRIVETGILASGTSTDDHISSTSACHSSIPSVHSSDPMETKASLGDRILVVETETETEVECCVDKGSSDTNTDDVCSPVILPSVLEVDVLEDKMEIDDLDDGQKWQDVKQEQKEPPLAIMECETKESSPTDLKQEQRGTVSATAVNSETADSLDPSMASTRCTKEQEQQQVDEESIDTTLLVTEPTISASSVSSLLPPPLPPPPLSQLPLPPSVPSSLKSEPSTDSLPEVLAPTGETETDTKTESRSGWRASALPRTKLSDFIEAMVQQRLKNSCNTTSMDGTGVDDMREHTPATGSASNGDDASEMVRETAPWEDIMKTLTIRVVANASRSMDVPDIITENLPTAQGHRVPPYFVYRQKCILLFQNIDGIDVCLFCLYVQEFDESCPEPNKSRVYIAYLDSVEYFRPRHLRTQVYFEIIIAYLKWAQTRGFKYGHIWACPPQRGDNFIFWCHPSQQRTPSRDRLTSWYNAMLSRAKTLGICSSVQNLWTCFFEGYGKRDEGLQRQASKNSYVGKQHHTIKASKQSKQSKKNLGRGTATATATVPACTTVQSTPSVKNLTGGDEVPICPPVFEGDFWVTECTRVYRLVHTRTQGVRYDKDKTLNQRKCRETLKTLMTKPIAYCFNQPVDPVALNIPDYLSVIKTPMDFGTVRDKLRSNSYRSMLEFAQDVRQTCKNALIYNPPAHVVHTLAQQLLDEFETMMADMVTERVGEIFASSNDVDTWLATYPVNSTMEKEEKKRRAKEQQQQRVLLAGQKGGGLDSSGVVEEPAAFVSTAASVSGVPQSDTAPVTTSGSGSGTTMAEVSSLMEVDAADEQLLHSLLMETNTSSAAGNGAGTGAGTVLGGREEPLQSTLCDTRRVFFSSDPQHNIDADSCDPQQQQEQPTPDDLNNYDGYGFVDYESGQSDVDSRNGNTDVGSNSDTGKGGSNGAVVTNSSVESDYSEAGLRAPNSSSSSSLTSSLSSSVSDSPGYSTLAPYSTQDPGPQFSGEKDEGRDDSQDSLLNLGLGLGGRGISRHDSMESVHSVVEQWPRRPDRTSSMCVEESSMEIFSTSSANASTSANRGVATATLTKAETGTETGTPLLPPARGERLSIDIAATQAVSVKFGMNSVGRKNALNTNLPFDKPQLGVKGAQALMSELSRNVCRLKDDMYVLIFTAPDIPVSATATRTNTNLAGANIPDINQDVISPDCLRLLQGIVPDTSDPDPVIRSPFIESRQTFLEMCQFRHLQFDCLRRAKYSSSLLIYHLLFPMIQSTRPHCKACARQIKNVRWHCEICQIELCNTCKYSKDRAAHQHEESLTPIRVSYR